MESWLPVIPVFLFHLGARHISFDLTDVQKNLFRQPVVQAIILMSMFFVSTKNLTLALLLTVCYYLVIYILLNEQHNYSIIPYLEKAGFNLRLDDQQQDKNKKTAASNTAYGTYTYAAPDTPLSATTGLPQ